MSSKKMLLLAGSLILGASLFVVSSPSQVTAIEIGSTLPNNENAPASGTITVSPSTVKVNQPFTITVTGSDPDGMQYVGIQETNNPRPQWSDKGSGPSFSKQWTITKSQAGTYTFLGYINGTNPTLLGSRYQIEAVKTTPVQISVTVTATGGIIPTPTPGQNSPVSATLSASATNVKVGQQFTLTIDSQDTDGVQWVGLGKGQPAPKANPDYWRRENKKTEVSEVWSFTKNQPGTYTFYGVVDGTDPTSLKEHKYEPIWTNPKTVTVTVTAAGTSPTSPPTGKSITVIHPNGGEIWTPGEGQQYNIRWNSKGVENVDIDLVMGTEEINEVRHLVTNYPASRGYNILTIPADVQPSTLYKVRIKDHDDSTVEDTSDNYFRILSSASGGSTPPSNQNNPASGILEVSATTVQINQSFTITINGHDLDGIRSVALKEDNENWQSVENESNSWSFTKNQPGTYTFYGKVTGTNKETGASEEVLTTPSTIRVRVIGSGLGGNREYEPKCTIHIKKDVAGAGDYTITVEGRDNNGVYGLTYWASDTKNWAPYKLCNPGVTFCKQSWNIHKDSPGTFTYGAGIASYKIDGSAETKKGNFLTTKVHFGHDTVPSGTLSLSADHAVLVESGHIPQGTYEEWEIPAGERYTLTLTGHDADGVRYIRLYEDGIPYNKWGYGRVSNLTLERSFLHYPKGGSYKYYAYVDGVNPVRGYADTILRDKTVASVPYAIYVKVVYP